MIRDERRSTVHMSQSDKEYLDQTLFTMTIISKTCKWILTMIPLRAWVVALLFLCITVATVTRSNAILAVVSMTVDFDNQETNGTNSSVNHICPLPEKDFETRLDIELPYHQEVNLTGLDVHELEYSMISIDDDDDGVIKLRDKVYAWSASTQSNIFGAFFWAYFVFMVPAGIISQQLGGRLVISICLLGASLISFNIPLVTDHVIAFIIMRFILGTLHAGLFPAAFAIVCNWIPMEERTVCLALLEVAANAGVILTFVASGWINEAFGWPALYFIPGCLAFCTFFLAITCIRDFPEEDEDESESLEVNHKDNSPKNEEEATETSKKITLPIKAILLNPAVASCALFKFGGRWSVLLVASKVPTYLKVVLHQDLSSNGYTNAIVFSLMAISLTVTGALSDQIINRGILSRTRCRKAFSLFSGFGVALTLMLIPAAGCCPYKLHLVLFINSICCGFMGGSDASLPSEMSTLFPAELYSILNMISMSAGFVAPAFAGLILDNMQDQWSAWCIVYWSSAFLLIFANIVFILFASAERQSFDIIEESKLRGSDKAKVLRASMKRSNSSVKRQAA